MRRAALLLVALLALAGGDAEAAKKKRKKRKATPPARVLVYSGTVGFRHQSIPYGNAVIARMGRDGRRLGRHARLLDEVLEASRREHPDHPRPR